MFTRLIYWRISLIAALIAAGIFAPVMFAAIPWLMLAAYLYLIFQPDAGRRFGIPFHLMLAMSLPLFFVPVTGTWLSPILVLPVLPLLDDSLRQIAARQDFTPASAKLAAGPRLTAITGKLAVSLGIIAAAALVLAGWTLLVSVGVVTLFLVIAIIISMHNKPDVSIAAGPSGWRVVAGLTGKAAVQLSTKGRRKTSGGYLLLDCRLPWFTVKPGAFAFKPLVELEAKFTPPLAGPASLEIDASYIDAQGLTRFDFTLKGLELLVIPRARYAEWMARKYLEMSRPGNHGAADSAAASNRSSRRGIEFYGLRPYQPGDTARSIDWKHTSKLHQVIVKEFVDNNAECAVIAVNLSAGDDEEKDKLVYDYITAALTLARENIPSAIAAYNHLEVIKVTPLLEPRQALIQALNLTGEVTVTPNRRRFQAVPDVRRIKSNLRMLKSSGTGPADRLAGLLEIEYASLERQAKQHAGTAALAGALAAMKTKPNIISISVRNDDAAALAFTRRLLETSGYRFIEAREFRNLNKVTA